MPAAAGSRSRRRSVAFAAALIAVWAARTSAMYVREIGVGGQKVRMLGSFQICHMRIGILGVAPVQNVPFGP